MKNTHATPSSHRPVRNVLVGTLTLSLLALSACSTKEASLPATQVAVKVGKEEISMHQINNALAQSNSRGSTPEQVQAQSRLVLESLIDQQVAVDKAVELKLNRDPDVIAQVEAARMGVLANAYVKQYVSALPKPAEQDAKTYYAAHPELFAARRVYAVQEIAVVRTPAVLEQLTRMAAAGPSLDEVAAWLKARQIDFKGTAASRSAEQIPLDLLPRMHALKDGQSLVYSTPAVVTYLHLQGSRTEPVSEALALPRITQYLGTQRTVDAVTAHIKDLRSKTAVVYQGEFAKEAASQAAGASATATATAQTPATSAASTPSAANPPGAASTALEKGVAGLK